MLPRHIKALGTLQRNGRHRSGVVALDRVCDGFFSGIVFGLRILGSALSGWVAQGVIAQSISWLVIASKLTPAASSSGR
jgi:hypothetical protein